MIHKSITLAIISGKGGVGKSLTAVNLAEMLCAQGRSVALLDVDFGQSASPVLLNESPAASVLDLVRHTAREADVLHRTVSGFTLVQGATEPGTADHHLPRLYETLDALVQRLRLTHEFILIDAPAGVDGPVRWALDRADGGLLVLVGEPTAISNAYHLAKLVWQSDATYPLSIVVNFADTEEEARSVAERFGLVTQHFTGQAPPFLGWIPFSSQLRRSVQEQTPAVRTPGPVRKAFADLAGAIEQDRTIPVPAHAAPSE